MKRINYDVISADFVFSDPVLFKDGTSQLSLLTEDAFLAGMARIEEAIRLAERHGREAVFPIDIALPIVTGFASDATQGEG
jgi:hypothetical protein